MATDGRKYPDDETGPALAWISRRMPSRFIQHVSTLVGVIFGYRYCFSHCGSSLSDPLVWSKRDLLPRTVCRAVHTCMRDMLRPGYNNGAACSVAQAPSSYSISRRSLSPSPESPQPSSSHEGQLRPAERGWEVVGQKSAYLHEGPMLSYGGFQARGQYHFKLVLLAAIRLTTFH